MTEGAVSGLAPSRSGTSGVRPGDTGLVALYRGNVAAARVLVPMPPKTDLKYPAEVNYVDTEVFAKLRKLNMVPSDAAGESGMQNCCHPLSCIAIALST